MKLTGRLAANLISILLLFVLTVGWVITSLVTGGLGTPMVVTADFAASGGVFSNQEVTYRGVLIGKTGELELNEDGVNIELLINAEWDGKIPADVIATVQSKSAVGEQFVNLTPQSSGGEMLADGDTIPRERTELPVDFQKLLRTLDRVLGDVPPETASRLVSNLADGLRGRSEDISTVIRSLAVLSDAFADVAPEQQTLLDNATTAGAAFLDTKDEFSRAIRAIDDVLLVLGETGLQRDLFAANDRLAREGIDLLARKGDKLESGIASLADFVHLQLDQRAEIVDALEYIPQFLHAIEDSSIPWQDPDGDRYFRIRAGLVYDNVQRSWPCRYAISEDYNRFPHERESKQLELDKPCEPSTSPRALQLSLLRALRAFLPDGSGAEDDPALDPSSIELPEAPFAWPISGPVTSPFGERSDGFHYGIDIGGETGDPVAAAAEGTVVHAGSYSEFGETVIVNHHDGYLTVYSHLSEISVTLGSDVARGDVVGAVGCTGDCDSDHLHFEINFDGQPVDPLDLLPGGPLFAPPEDAQ